MKSMTGLIIAAFAATLLPATIAFGADAKNQGYLIDSREDIVRSGTGLCWHTSEWTPARAVEGCDPTNKAVLAAAPAPAPKTAAGNTAMTQKISFSGDALFAFDKSTLKPEGKAMLDKLVRQLDGATNDTIVVTGHTDRFGSNAYNQKLSERRAQTVKNYLVGMNVQASRIDAEGKGETQPVTKTDECRGAKSKKVIACLQPDRRVDIEMTGSKPAAGS